MLELVRRSGYVQVTLGDPEAERARRSDWQHKGPFDRLSVAQDELSGLRPMTADWAIFDFEPPAFDAVL